MSTFYKLEEEARALWQKQNPYYSVKKFQDEVLNTNPSEQVLEAAYNLVLDFPKEKAIENYEYIVLGLEAAERKLFPSPLKETPEATPENISKLTVLDKPRTPPSSPLQELHHKDWMKNKTTTEHLEIFKRWQTLNKPGKNISEFREEMAYFIPHESAFSIINQRDWHKNKTPEQILELLEEAIEEVVVLWKNCTKEGRRSSTLFGVKHAMLKINLKAVTKLFSEDSIRAFDIITSYDNWHEAHKTYPEIHSMLVQAKHEFEAQIEPAPTP